MRPNVARAAVPTRLYAGGAGASTLLWLRAIGLPAMGTLLGGIAAFTTFSIADHFYATLGIATVAALLCAGALRGALVRLVRDRALRRIVAASTIVDGANALSHHAEGTRVRVRGIARAAGHAHRGWLFQRRAGLFDTALDFWLVDEHGGRTFVEIADARLLGPTGLRDGDAVEVSGVLARRVDRTMESLHRDVPLRPILRADRAPLVVAPGTGPAHAL